MCQNHVHYGSPKSLMRKKKILDGTRDCFCSCAYYKALLQCPVFSWTMTNALQFGQDLSEIPELSLCLNWILLEILLHWKFLVLYFLSISKKVLLNYENKLVKIKKLLNAWARRHLTQFSKITFIKTLALSKLTDVFINLPDPNETCLDDLN